MLASETEGCVQGLLVARSQGPSLWGGAGLAEEKVGEQATGGQEWKERQGSCAIFTSEGTWM